SIPLGLAAVLQRDVGQDCHHECALLSHRNCPPQNHSDQEGQGRPQRAVVAGVDEGGAAAACVILKTMRTRSSIALLLLAVMMAASLLWLREVLAQPSQGPTGGPPGPPRHTSSPPRS